MGTIKVRIAVVVNSEGSWNAGGHNGMTDAKWIYDCLDEAECEHTVWVEAEIPLPEMKKEQTVQGEVINEC